MKTKIIFLHLLLSYALAINFTQAQISQVNFTNGLKAYYPMNNSQFWAAGVDYNSHPEFTSATFTIDRYGNATNAGNFNAGDQRLNIGNRLIAAQSGNFTIETWFRSSVTSATQVLFWEGVVGGFNVWLRLEPTSNRIRGLAGSTTSFVDVVTTNSYCDGNWHHIAFSVSNTATANIYIDGALSATNTNAFTPGQSVSTSISRVGIRDDLTQDMQGQIDEMRVWQRVLSLSEIIAIYNMPRIAIQTVTPSTFCAGSSISIPFTVTSGSMASGNIFYAQLSDASGSFIAPTIIGSITSTTSGTINTTIPQNVTTGTGYRIRVLASRFPLVSENITQALTINNPKSFTNYDIHSNLLVHFKMDGNTVATDYSNWGNDGQISGSMLNDTGFNTTAPNTALNFNNSGKIYMGRDYPIEILNGTTSSFSISTWVYQRSTPSTWSYLWASWDPNIPNGAFLGTTNAGNIRFRINSNTSVQAPLPNNQWVHVVATYNGATGRIYMNGVQVASAALSGSITLSNPPQMGWDPIANAAFFNGSLDEFRMYGRALTLQEAEMLYRDGALCSSNSPVCNNGVLNLYGPTYSTLLYNWSGPNGYSSTSEDPIINNFNPFSQGGYYYVNYTLNGCVSSADSTLVLSGVPAASSVTHDTICVGQTATVTASGASMGQQYYWYSDAAGTNLVALNVASYSYSPVVTDTVYVAIYNGSNCFSNLVPVYITVNPLPTVTASANPSNATVCLGQQITLNGAGATTYSWSGGVVNNVAFSPTATTTYTVYGTNSNGCSNTNTITVTVNPLPTVTASANPSNATVCLGQQITLNGAGATTYSWSGGVVNNVAFSPTATTTYTVYGTNSNGCSNTSTMLVTVNPLPTLPITANPLNASVCIGQQVTLTASGATTYSWSGGVVNNVAFSPTTTTTYTVYGTNSNGCSNTNTITVTVNQIPSVIANATNITVCEGANPGLSASGANTYLWMPGNLTGSNPIVNPTTTTTYTVTGTSSSGCTNTSTVTINVNPLPAVTYNETQTLLCVSWAPITLTAGTPANGTYSGTAVTGNTFDPSVAGQGTFNITYSYTDINGCTNTDVSQITVDLCTSTGNTPEGNSDFIIFPNPVNGIMYFNFELKNSSTVSLKLYDSAGRLVFVLLEDQLQQGAHQYGFNTTEFSSGLYFYTLKINEETITKKIVIEN